MKKIFLGLFILMGLAANAQTQIKLTQLEPSGAAWSIMRTNASKTCGFMAPGANGQFLGISGGALAWLTPSVGSVTSVSAGTGMNFSTITSSGSVAIDITKVPYYSSGFSALGLARWNGSNWLIDATSYQPSISLTTTGSSGAASFGSSTLNIPNYTLAGLGGIGLSSLSATSPLSYNNSTGAFSIPAATSSVNGYLSSADWTTFSNKQNAITLTTTGTSGAATFSGSTLNIPNYTLAGLGGISGNQTITLNGAVAGSGTIAITTTLGSGVVGIANLSATGTPSSSTYLRGDNTWASVSAGMTNPMTTQGDIIYGGSSGTPTRLGLGTTNYFLQAGVTAPQYFDLFGTANTWSKTQTFTSGSSATGITVNGNGLASTSSPDIWIGGSSNRAMIKLGGGSSSQGAYLYYNDNTAATKGLIFNLTDATSNSGQGFIFYPVNLSNTPFGIYPKYTGAGPATQMEFPGSHDVRIVQRGGNSSSRYLRFYTDNNLGASDVERFAIQGGSNSPYAYFNNIVGLGVGVTTPVEMLEVSGNAKINHLIGRTSVPTIAAGVGAGTSPTIAISGTDLSGNITITTGTLPTAASTVATITFNTAYGVTPKTVLITGADLNGATICGANLFAAKSDISTSVFKLTGTLVAATTYTIYYTIFQ